MGSHSFGIWREVVDDADAAASRLRRGIGTDTKTSHLAIELFPFAVKCGDDEDEVGVSRIACGNPVNALRAYPDAVGAGLWAGHYIHLHAVVNHGILVGCNDTRWCSN